jgi:hypothetical protein
MDPGRDTTAPTNHRNNVSCSRNILTSATYRKNPWQFHVVLLIMVGVVLIQFFHFPSLESSINSKVDDENGVTSRTTAIANTESTASAITIQPSPSHIATTSVSKSDSKDVINDSLPFFDDKLKALTNYKHALKTEAFLHDETKKEMTREEAIADYRTLVQKSNTSANRCMQQRQQQNPTAIRMESPLNCLQLTNGNISLQYPISNISTKYDIKWHHLHNSRIIHFIRGLDFQVHGLKIIL